MLVDGVTKLDKVEVRRVGREPRPSARWSSRWRAIPRCSSSSSPTACTTCRTLRFMPADKQQRTAKQTLEIYAPLAHRLGMNTIKWELEDLVVRDALPQALRRDRAARRRARAVARHLPRQRDEQVQTELRNAKLKATVTGRPKHYYSIYQKMIVRGRDFADIYDLVGLRVLVETERDCYAALGVIHTMWSAGARPVQGLHRDAQVQHVPVAAHDGDRARGQAGRGADPHPRRCTAGRSTASPRTGSTRSSTATSRT